MTKQLDSLPSDVEITMTTDLIRAFKIEGCDPACHCCYRKIIAGEKFKLSMIDALGGYNLEDTKLNDEMLCCDCTPDMLIAHKEHLVEENLKALHRSRCGYTRKHK